MESHLGSYAVAGLKEAPAALQAALLCAVLAFGGISSLLLAGGAAAGTGMKLSRLLAAKLLHAGAAFALCLTLWRPLGALASEVVPTTSAIAKGTTFTHSVLSLLQTATNSLWPVIPVFCLLFTALVLLMIAVSGIATLFTGSRQ